MAIMYCRQYVVVLDKPYCNSCDLYILKPNYNQKRLYIIIINILKTETTNMQCIIPSPVVWWRVHMTTSVQCCLKVAKCEIT